MTSIQPCIHVSQASPWVGEPVYLGLSRRADTRVDVREILPVPHSLTIRRPNDQTVVHSYATNQTYNGPAHTKAVSTSWLLNDLAHPLTVGSYELTYACAGAQMHSTVHVQERPYPIRAMLHLPARFDPKVDSLLPLMLRVHNPSDERMALLEPGRYYDTQASGYITSESPRWWSRLDPPRMFDVDVAPRVSNEVDELQRASLRSDSWREFQQGLQLPGNPIAELAKFEIRAGVVVFAWAEDVNRPMPLLVRVHGKYDDEGCLKSSRADGNYARWIDVAHK